MGLSIEVDCKNELRSVLYPLCNQFFAIFEITKIIITPISNKILNRFYKKQYINSNSFTINSY